MGDGSRSARTAGRLPLFLAVTTRRLEIISNGDFGFPLCAIAGPCPVFSNESQVCDDPSAARSMFRGGCLDALVSASWNSLSPYRWTVLLGVGGRRRLKRNR